MMGDTQFEVNLSSFDTPRENACSNLFKEATDSLDVGCPKSFDSNAASFLPPLSIADTDPSAVQLVQSERVDSALSALFSPAYADQMRTIDGYDDPGTVWNGKDGEITKRSVEQWLTEASNYQDTMTMGTEAGEVEVATDKATRYPADLVAKLTQLDQLWNTDAANSLKDGCGNFTADSFNAGKGALESSIQTMSQSAGVETAGTEASPADVAQNSDTTSDGIASTPNDLYKVIADATTVQPGEGPYQSAERLLSMDGAPVDHSAALALAHALRDQYTSDQQAQGLSGDPTGMKVNTQLLTGQNVNAVLSRIADEGVRQRLAKILGVC